MRVHGSWKIRFRCPTQISLIAKIAKVIFFLLRMLERGVKSNSLPNLKKIIGKTFLNDNEIRSEELGLKYVYEYI